MSYENFIAQSWSKHIQTRLEKACVMLEDCNRQFEGDVTHAGRVKILGVARPSLTNYTGASLGTPETVADSSVYLDIDTAKAFNFMVDDVDKAQSTPGLMEALTEEAGRALAEARDTYIAALAVNAGHFSSSLAVSTAAAAKAAIDEAFITLWENDVKLSDEVTICLPPWFYSLFKDSMNSLFTDNTEIMRSGVIGLYNAAKVKLTDNLYNDGTDDYIMVRTKRAIAFAGQLKKIEAYRPEDLFADALKGLDVYGGKVVRPDEIYVIKAHQ